MPSLEVVREDGGRRRTAGSRRPPSRHLLFSCTVSRQTAKPSALITANKPLSVKNITLPILMTGMSAPTHDGAGLKSTVGVVEVTQKRQQDLY